MKKLRLTRFKQLAQPSHRADMGQKQNSNLDSMHSLFLSQGVFNDWSYSTCLLQRGNLSFVESVHINMNFISIFL